jgi:predicted N-acetyltransferase YhbS
MQALGVSFRVANNADAAAIFEVHQASVHGLCKEKYSAEHLAAWFQDRTPDIYSPAISEGGILVAEHEGRVLGFVGAEPGEVTLLFIRPEVVGKGLGHRLFELGLSMARASFNGAVVVVATTNSEKFYERWGFLAVEQQSFSRGQQQLLYPVVKMREQQREEVHGAATEPDA